MSSALADEAVVKSSVISAFKIGSNETRFGPFEFLGGLEMVSSNHLFGSLSSIRFESDQTHFVGVLDTGQWMTGRIERDAKGGLSGLADVEITPMKNRAAQSFEGKGHMDAEGLALHGDRVLVSFEQDHRVDVYPNPGFETSRAIDTIPIPFQRRSLRSNRGFETVAVAPQESPLKGGTLIVAERSLDADGNAYAAILDGPLKGRLALAHYGDYDATDGVFLPSGDLLLLERRFNMAEGIGMRIRRIKSTDIKPDAVMDGEVLMQADFGYQIDNMEGIDAFTAADGTTHVVIVSDDNHSILQRNLMLEFRLVE
ncbi:esterase-like activity of phytase family protein [Rhizobium sp. S96]|uniref:esterase-like activity of phytase family protein n=1 Tax=Rhizobium sp. S96 TaxID=3055140 RepID=UPI0025AB2F35|nr:esterase-like activity of phytase family protein [Rhizobium sp. S96]MDM9621496.1 esterase-like activity of phytase family protein [Rhizobium sp. S96]